MSFDSWETGHKEGDATEEEMIFMNCSTQIVGARKRWNERWKGRAAWPPMSAKELANVLSGKQADNSEV